MFINVYGISNRCLQVFTECVVFFPAWSLLPGRISSLIAAGERMVFIAFIDPHFCFFSLKNLLQFWGSGRQGGERMVFIAFILDTSTESKSSTRLFKFSNFRDQYLLWRLLNGTIKIVLIKLTLGDADYVEQFARLYGPYLLTLGWFWSFYVRRIRSGVISYWPPFLLFFS